MVIKTHYQVIKEPRVGDGPTRLVGTFETREEAEQVAREESSKEENSLFRISVEADPPE